MTTPAERFKGWIDSLSEAWKDRLRGWMASWVLKGIEDTFEDLETKPREGLLAILDELIASPDTPSTIKPVLEKIRGHQSPAWLTTILFMLGAIIVSTVLTQFTPTLSSLRHSAEKLAKTYRLDPLSTITAWRRDPEKYAALFEDLKDQGWDDARIEALKFYTEFIPNADEQTLWLAREVYEPEMIAKYGLDDELPVYEETDFSKVGVNPEQMRNKWRAHWMHASWMQMVEMLHRGLVTEEDVYEWFRLVEIVPFWRDLLIQSAYTWPTRVDVRRWWDMRTISPERLEELYKGMGYRGDNLKDYVLWTKVYVAFPDLIARWSKGWITEDDVRSELTALGMPAARVDEMIETKISATAGDRTEAERALTKAEIIKGVKTGVIDRGEAADLLGDMGYDEDDADFILEINIPLDEVEVVVKQRELTKADIIKGLKTEVITESQAHDRLVELRYTPDDADFLLKIFLATITPPAEPRDREASKADIVLAVKKGLITPEDGYLMLQDIGFTPEASEFILMVKAEASPFSPINFAEFKDLTQKYRKAAGMAAKPVPEELKKAADEVVKLTGEVKSLQEAVKAEEGGLIKEEVLPEAATAKLDELRVALHRAEAELFAAQTNYNSLIAQWRHGG